MTYDEIFTAEYSLFRADADVPTSSDDEYKVGMQIANESINRHANYEGTYWKEYFTTLQQSTQTVPALVTTITAGTTSYTCPTDFKEAGGFVKVIDVSGNVAESYPVVDPPQVQFLDEASTFCYFVGNPKDGYTLQLSPAPSARLNGMDINYIYYKTPTLFTTGTDVTEMSNPYFIVHRMLAMQYRAARNPYYTSALRDSEDILKNMQMDNNSGSWASPPAMADNTGSVWGQ